MTALLRNLLVRIRPKFWDTRTPTSPDQILFNYRRFWLFSIFLRATVSLVPMTILLIFSYMLQDKAIKNENHLRTERLTSNTRRTISFFLEERFDALRFLTKEMKFEIFLNSKELSYILENLKIGFGGFVDLGLIDPSGTQITYAGPFNLKGKNYSDQDWFNQCLKGGSYVSDVFLGYRGIPHMIIALRLPRHSGSHYVLRATLDMKKLIQILSSLELTEKGDTFLSNREGVLQTPSKYYGGVFEPINLPIPEYSVHSRVMETLDEAGNPILIGSAYIDNSPYILMVVKRSAEIMKGWHSIREKINWFFFASVVVILIVVVAVSTYMENRIYQADQARLKAMQKIESSSRLISIGRLAAGVAHEINNPLAVIGENAGLIKDLLKMKKENHQDQRLIGLIDDVLDSVDRCGEVTRELLGFARHFEPKIEPIKLTDVISEVLSFHKKEALYRNIAINIDVPENLPIIYSDHGKLQQIFLNLINNSFQAMDKGGRLDVTARTQGDDSITVAVTDTGSGISEEDQKRIFEPFFTSKSFKGGTGLGLSITYGLVQKLHGDISVESTVGEGTTFSITLPIRLEREIKNEDSTG